MKNKINYTEIICDKCGAKGKSGEEPFRSKYIEGVFSESGVSFLGEFGGTSIHIDLCNACVDSFHTWLKNK